MLEVDHQLREPDRNELFARAARSIGNAETIVRQKLYKGADPWDALDNLVQSQQAMLMLIVKIERMAENAIRSR